MGSLAPFPFPLKNPRPDFKELVAALNGKPTRRQVHPVEMLIDEEVKKFIIENYFGETNYPPVATFGGGSGGMAPLGEDVHEAARLYYDQLIRFYWRMGYSVVADYDFLVNFQGFNTRGRVGQDPESALMRRDARHWAEEGSGMIRNAAEFERFPWARVEELADRYPEHIAMLTKLLPDGMKIAVVGSVLEQVMEWLLGYEVVFTGMYDQPDLIEAVFERVGGIVDRLYRNVAGMEGVGVIWHGDDIGFNLGTMLPVSFLRRTVFPWFKKYAATAHKQGKPAWFHGCGNKKTVMEDLIGEVRFDAIHSFEDASCPVMDYKRAYGARVALLGGIDVDRMARSPEKELRRYVREVLDVCTAGGRFALGSGNSICNYIPVENYLIMLDEGMRYT